MPNVMAALPNIGGASVQRRKVWLTPISEVSCSNAVKTRNPIKLGGVPQTTEPISSATGSKFTSSCEHMWRRYCCLISFFLIVDMCLNCEDIARQSCAMVPRWRFFGEFLSPVFSASRVKHVSELHPKFALMPHHVWKYGRHQVCDGWD